jgi:DnaJ domain
MLGLFHPNFSFRPAVNNRRNYYRILHVQPEAPLEIIKASYRSLMSKLNAHPDRGGDHDAAVLINQAYAVLGDPQRRKKYDELLVARSSSRFSRTDSNNKAENGYQWSTNATGNNPHQSNKENPKTASPNDRRYCFFCGTGHLTYVNKYCIHCQSPLAATQSYHSNSKQELLGRRAVPRINKGGSITLYPSWPHSGYSAVLQDLSMTGSCLLTAYPAKVGQTLKFDSDFIKGVARVVIVRTSNPNYLVHVTFLAAEFYTKSGVFVAEKA